MEEKMVVMKVVFVDGQLLMGKSNFDFDPEVGQEFLTLSDVFEIKIMPINDREAQVIAMTPQHMKDKIVIPIGNFVKFYGQVDDEGLDFYKKQTMKMRAKKSGLDIPNDKDIQNIKRR